MLYPLSNSGICSKMLEYYSPYVTVLASQDSSRPSTPQEERSSGFLNSLKTFVQHPLSRSRSPRRFRPCSEDHPKTVDSKSMDEIRQNQPSNPKSQNIRHIIHHRTPTASSMEDYLTLGQLETIWHQQEARTEIQEKARESHESSDRVSSDRGRQPQMIPCCEIHPALRPRHLCSNSRTSQTGDCHHHPSTEHRWI